MIDQGKDRYGAEYKRTSNDFHFRRLEHDNRICSICHGTGAKIEFEYVTRNYESAKQKGKICKICKHTDTVFGYARLALRI